MLDECCQVASGLTGNVDRVARMLAKPVRRLAVVNASGKFEAAPVAVC